MISREMMTVGKRAGRAKRSTGSVLKLSPADLRIIRYLQADARESAAKIASRIGMPESTVRHRINRLVTAGVIEFTVLTDPLHLGYQIWTVMEVHVELPKVRLVARRLAELPEVYFVALATGGYDIFVAAVFRSNDEVVRFITDRLAKIPGIVQTSTSSLVETVKRSMTYPIPDDMIAEADQMRGMRGRKHRRTNPQSD